MSVWRRPRDASEPPVQAGRTALLVIDMLRDYLDADAPRALPSGRAILPRIAGLVSRCRELGVVVVYCVHAHAEDGSDLGRMAVVAPGLAGPDGRPTALVRGALGTELAPPLRAEAGDEVVHKTRHSAFFQTSLHELLVARGVDTVAICGMATNFCCVATARDALHRDYRVIAVSDCMATCALPDCGWGPVSEEAIAAVALSTMAFGLGEVLTADELVARVHPRDVLETA